MLKQEYSLDLSVQELYQDWLYAHSPTFYQIEADKIASGKGKRTKGIYDSRILADNGSGCNKPPTKQIASAA